MAGCVYASDWRDKLRGAQRRVMVCALQRWRAVGGSSWPETRILMRVQAFIVSGLGTKAQRFREVQVRLKSYNVEDGTGRTEHGNGRAQRRHQHDT